MTRLDLIMEGNFGLMQAIDHFNPCLGFKFSTYAYLWIITYILRSIPVQDFNTTITYSTYENYRRWKKISKKINEETNSKHIDYQEIARRQLKDKNPTEEQIIKLSKRIEDTFKYVQQVKTVSSLDVPLDGSEEGETIVDLQENKNAINPQNEAEYQELILVIKKILSEDDRIDDRDIDCFNRKHGLMGYIPQTLNEIGKVHNLSREGIRQILIKVNRVIRDPLYESLFREHVPDFYKKRVLLTPTNIKKNRNKTKIKK